MPQIRVAIETLGCKLNQAESESLARDLSSAGYALVPAGGQAEVYVLNSCTVTHVADRKSRQLIRAARRLNPEALIVATGCYAERSATDMKAAGADVVVGVTDKTDIIDLVRGRLPHKTGPLHERQFSRTRAFVKVQDGCNRHCSYCIVPLVRGGEKSLAVDAILAEIDQRVSEGFKEIVLTGTEVGAYSNDGAGITGLIERILNETRVERVRVSSLQPFEITPELLELWENPRLCRHFHISLQSGSNAILKGMQRGYDTAGYTGAVESIMANMPDAAITTDIIVGFPGETDKEFQRSMAFCRRAGFARIHVFPFSPRPGAPAASMQGQVPELVKKDRARQMLALAKEAAAAFRSQSVGNTTEALWEYEQSGLWSGYTGNYIRVYTRSSGNLTNVLSNVKLVKAYKDGIFAELFESEETK